MSSPPRERSLSPNRAAPRRSPSRSPRRDRSASPRDRRRYDRRSRSPRDRRRSPSPRDRRYRSRSRSRDRYRSPPRYRDRSPRRSRSRSPRGGYEAPVRREPPAPGTQVFVAGFNFLSTERDVEKRFGRYGRVVEVRIVREPSGKSRGFGFVAYDNTDSARECIDRMNGTDWEGRRLQVELCRNPK